MSATPAAPDPLPGIVAGHGPVLIHRSGGRCDGSSPMAISRSAILARRRSVSAPRGGGGFPRARPSARYRSRRRRPVPARRRPRFAANRSARCARVFWPVSRPLARNDCSPG
ncbi:DUF779 domain-containing protein [uncultured Amaricoccus sp.]|uniref:DUF779 domain-containing protein n=1 Tax=uncultured Amaricoccus sp. TaxID=339341 RepID=UPI00260CD739|nr:DUF779 domain-containing protein [uncultured Amaricoccus sp.]